MSQACRQWDGSRLDLGPTWPHIIIVSTDCFAPALKGAPFRAQVEQFRDMPGMRAPQNPRQIHWLCWDGILSGSFRKQREAQKLACCGCLAKRKEHEGVWSVTKATTSRSQRAHTPLGRRGHWVQAWGMGRCHPGEERELLLPGALREKWRTPEAPRASPGQEAEALPVLTARKELPTEGGIGEHTTCPARNLRMRFAS